MPSKSGGRTSGGTAAVYPAAAIECLLEAAPDAMVGVDRGGVIRLVNLQTELLFGYDRDDLLGQPLEILVPETFRRLQEARWDSYVTDPFSRDPRVDQGVNGRKRDGTEFAAEISIFLIETEDGLLATAAVRDMTARNRAAQGVARVDILAAVVEFSGEVIISSTLEGIITSFNPAAERMFGYSRDEVIGKSDGFMSPESRSRESRDIVCKTATRLNENVETTRVRKDGTVFPVTLTVSPICDEGGATVSICAIVRDVTEQQQALQTAQQMAAIVEHSHDAIIGRTLEGTITSWNPAAERMYGYSRDEVIGKPIELLSPEGRTGDVHTRLAKIGAGQPVEHMDTTRVRKDGTVFPVSFSVSPIRDPDGTIIGASTIARDVTEQKQAAQNARNLAAAEDLVHTVMASASIGIALADLDGNSRVVNRSLCDLLGYGEEWFLAHRLDDMIHPDDIEEILQRRARDFAGSLDASAVKMRMVRADGATVWVRRVAVLIPGGDVQPNLLMVQMEDITGEHEAQQALAYQAFHDPLTGLHNRAWILDILQVDLPAAKRLCHSVGALFVDLDNFKVVNDSLGHAAGDEVLATVAERIVAALRPGDRVGRFGGDEFVIVVQDVQDVVEVERCAERVSASIAVELQVQGHRIVPTASIGIAVSTSTSTPDSLLRDADFALFRAKSAGRAGWQFFDDAMHAQAVARLTIEDQLRDAITQGEFVVYYQRIVALADAHVVGHEALVRWAHPTRGLLSPGDFLDVAEDTRLITAIGAQVLDQACATLADRPDLHGAISINVSAVQLAAPDWLTSVRDTLKRHRVDPARIVIEITETAVLNLVDSARHALTSLRDLGVGIYVDDFGTGYSSISLLRDLPVTGVKLDLRFVHDLTASDSQANALTHGLSGLVNGMHLTGIAEGIETKRQADILRAQGWECGQGYYFGRPNATPATD